MGKILRLPAGTEHLTLEEVAEMAGEALFPDNLMRAAAAQSNLEDELKAAVERGALKVRDPLTLRPHPFPIGEALMRARVMVDDLNAFFAGDFVLEVGAAMPGSDEVDSREEVEDRTRHLVHVTDREGLPTSEIAYAFGQYGGWSAQQWTHELRRAEWLKKCRLRTGARGKAAGGDYLPNIFDPLALARAVLSRGKLKPLEVRRVFRSNEAFRPWKVEADLIAEEFETQPNGR